MVDANTVLHLHDTPTPWPSLVYIKQMVQLVFMSFSWCCSMRPNRKESPKWSFLAYHGYSQLSSKQQRNSGESQRWQEDS